MKNIYFLGVIFFFITSCSIQKRQHLNGYYFSWNKSKKQNEISKQENTDTIVYHANERIDLIASTENNYDFIKKQPYNEKIDDCDILIFQSGEEIKVKITEITLNEIKYSLCNDPNSKIISIDKSKVFMIKYPNGKNEMIKSEKSDTKTEKAPQRIDYQTAHKSKKMQPFSLIAFIFAIITIFTMAVFGLTAGWFFIPAIFGIVAAISGIIGLISIKNNPDKYKGKAFSVLGIIFGLIFAALALIFLAILI